MEKWNGQVIKSILIPFETYGNWLIYDKDNGNDKVLDADAWQLKFWNAKAGVEGQDAVKTQYDPCPEGWRVPTMEEWKAIGVTKELLEAGMSWDVPNMRFSIEGKDNGQNLILPIAGYKMCNDSGITSELLGQGVIYWSSACYNNPGTNTYSSSALLVYGYNTDDKLTTQPIGRATLAPVRCIHE